MRITPSCLRAADAGKHIIMEKPLTGYFGTAGDYFTEKLETKAGWNRPSCDENWFRGFAQEIEDFVEAIRDGREPRSGIARCVLVRLRPVSFASLLPPQSHARSSRR